MNIKRHSVCPKRNWNNTKHSKSVCFFSFPDWKNWILQNWRHKSLWFLQVWLVIMLGTRLGLGLIGWAVDPVRRRFHVPVNCEHLLGGGFKYFLCSPLLGKKISNFTNIFQMGWNHQPAHQTTELPEHFAWKMAISKGKCTDWFNTTMFRDQQIEFV